MFFCLSQLAMVDEGRILISMHYKYHMRIMMLMMMMMMMIIIFVFASTYPTTQNGNFASDLHHRTVYLHHTTDTRLPERRASVWQL